MGICNTNNRKRNKTEESVEENVKNNFTCKFNDDSGLIELLTNFTEKMEIQDSFYETKDSSNNNLEDNTYDIIKKEEKRELTEYFNLKKEIFINNISKINLNKNFNFDSLSSQIIANKNGDKTYENKIENEISKINSNKESFKINNLNIMLVGKSGVGKSTLINSVLKIKEANTGTGISKLQK